MLKPSARLPLAHGGRVHLEHDVLEAQARQMRQQRPAPEERELQETVGEVTRGEGQLVVAPQGVGRHVQDRLCVRALDLKAGRGAGVVLHLDEEARPTTLRELSGSRGPAPP